MDSNIHVVQQVYNQMTAWSWDLNDWINYLSSLIPMSTRVQDNIDFGDGEVTRKSLKEFKDKLKEHNLKASIESLGRRMASYLLI
ncbi:unnamed protein product, partial [Mesorhabditis belari]|uniref:Uncharacterized protein n=1 Tax=Mesorhabditis belari TaxID=2138241 RepID=A0AAF3F463_9BILA